MNQRTVDARALLSGIGAVGWFAILAAILALVIAFRVIVSFSMTLLATDGVDSSDPQALQLARYAERHQEAIERDAQRFVGRSAFFVPPAPVPPPPPPPPPRDPVETPPPRDPGPPPPPSSYGGPKIAYVWDDRVTFENDMTLIVGGEGQSGVEVLETNLPWSVKVRWREVEFDVQLFERTTPSFLVDPSENNDQAGERSGDL